MSEYRGRGRGRGRGGGGGGPPKGMFTNGVWHCDCNPRAPAIHFETKKAGPNQGRWFRSCQKPEGARCGFFLWDDQAQPREQAALMNNSRTEPGHTNPTTPSKRQPSPPPYTIETRPSEPSRKRTRLTRSDSDEHGCGDDDFNSELNEIMTGAETPSKGKRKLPWQLDQPVSGSSHGLQTPRTDRKTSGDAAAIATPILGSSRFTPKAHEGGSRRTETPSSPCDTPTPSRFRSVGAEDLVADVFALLQGTNTHPSAHTEGELRSLLAKHAKSAEGYKRGRDVIRTTVRAKDAKIAELNFRINTLEAELEAEKAMVKHLQWEAHSEDPDT
ncbi:hypothetical protein T440DRAFT_518095 [Plenodomus tracheiphilus IPT5]|uniref:GRF-type domain-containing protein n=1 Tax=Plenodomus tracheiphilus IPT5 TaxID=1408161 RepID=A0A6A7B642_9PLEO|nr:hypothetical protein T440DRAFT_518095 [Plenodomus tracheiphilus IPT5]